MRRSKRRAPAKRGGGLPSWRTWRTPAIGTANASVEEQASVTQSISANMQVAAKGVTEVNASLNEITGSANSVDEATRKVKEASRALA